MLLNKKYVLKLLSIQSEESYPTFLLFLFACSMGMIKNILFSVPLAMFLSHYNSDLLPYIYIGAGVAICISGIAFSYLMRVASVFYSLSIPIALFAVSLFLLWGLLFLIDAPWIFVILLIWSIVIAIFVISAVMLWHNQLFNFQQSKRLSRLMICGIAIGGIIVGFGMDGLVKSIGPHHVILLAALLLFLGVVIQYLMRAHVGDRQVRFDQSEERGLQYSLKERKYIFSAFLFTVLGYFIFYNFDLLLNTVVEQHFPDEVEMAAFYGLLNAIYNIAGLFTGIFLSSWILSKLGLIASLFLWPIGLVILLTITFFLNSIPSFSEILFLTILVTAVFEVAIFNYITSGSILLLFQPLRPVQRAQLQSKNNIIIAPLAITAIGSILVLVNKYFGVQVSIISVTIILLSLCEMAVIFFLLKKGYLSLLIKALSKRRIIQPQFTTIDKDTLIQLKRYVTSPYPEEVIYVLQTIEMSDQKEFIEVLVETVPHPSEEVRCFCLSKVEQYRVRSMANTLKKMMMTEENPVVLGKIFQALGSLINIEEMAEFKKSISDSNNEIAKGAIIAFIKYGSEALKKEMLETLARKVHSIKEEERLQVVEIIKNIDIPNKVDILAPLLKDTDLEVRRTALEAVASFQDERLWSIFLDNLVVPHTHNVAFNNLVLLGSLTVEYIIHNFDHFLPDIQKEMVHVLGCTKDLRSVRFLEKLLLTSSQTVLHRVLLSLKQHYYKVIHSKEYNVVRILLESERKRFFNIKKLANILKVEKVKLVHDLLCREMEFSQECCFLLMTFIYPEHLIMQGQQGILSTDEELQSHGIEILLQTLSNADQKVFMDLLTYSPYQGEMRTSIDSNILETALLKVAEYASDCFIPELLSAVIYTIGALQVKNLIQLVHKQARKEEPLMKEMVSWSLNQL